jgi:hypothetical protein
MKEFDVGSVLLGNRLAFTKSGLLVKNLCAAVSAEGRACLSGEIQKSRPVTIGEWTMDGRHATNAELDLCTTVPRLPELLASITIPAPDMTLPGNLGESMQNLSDALSDLSVALRSVSEFLAKIPLVERIPSAELPKSPTVIPFPPK